MNERSHPITRAPSGDSRVVAETKTRILDAAERLFAERGLEATSIRDITGAAEANLGAINYHFGTKQELVAAVLNRRFGPLNERRLALLDDVERNAGDKPPALEALLEAMIRPSLEGSLAGGKKNTAFMRLMGRCHSEPNAEVEKLIRAQFQKLMSRFTAAFRRVLPQLPHDELFWRQIFIAGALQLAVWTLSKEESTAAPSGKRSDPEGLVKRLVTFTAAGMRAAGQETC